MNDWQIGMQMMARAPAPPPSEIELLKLKPMPGLSTAEELEQMVTMHKQGYSLVQIGKVIGRTKSYVHCRLIRSGNYAPEQVTNRRADVENMLRTGKCSTILIASDLQMSLKYVHHILRTTPGVEVERIGRKSLYRLPA